jgi:hypothetical protein
LRHVTRGGTYLRVASPDWHDPLNPDYAGQAGGRWNPPRSFGVVYLNRTLDVARELVRKRLTARGIHPEDVKDDQGPVLVTTTVPEDRYVDALTRRGLAALGLPATYPVDGDGTLVAHAQCQPVGRDAWDSGEPGIACRSAAATYEGAEELAFFGREALVAQQIDRFPDWYA